MSDLARQTWRATRITARAVSDALDWLGEGRVASRRAFLDHVSEPKNAVKFGVALATGNTVGAAKLGFGVPGENIEAHRAALVAEREKRQATRKPL